MSSQPSLFHEDLSDALRACVQALGGYKSVGVLLRPELPADQAGRWLSDTLNPARRDSLHPEQMLVILRESRKVGCHAGMAFIAHDTGYQEPQPLEPEDERAKLKREFIQMMKVQQSLVARMERLGLSA